MKENVERNSNYFIIEPPRGWVPFRLGELWSYRELLYFLVWRDVKVRYKQTVIGVSWAILQPFMIMIVFSIFFGKLAKIPSDGVPYPIFTYAALLPWQLFSHSLSATGNSLVENQGLITKVYFPRLLVPLSTVIVGLVDFCFAFVILLAMMLYYGIYPALALLALPCFVFLAVLATLAVGLWLSALNVQYRDVRYTLTFLTQLWLFATPVAYPASLVPEQWRALYALNPMVGVVEGFRWSLLNQAEPLTGSIIVSTIVLIVLLIGGLIYFRHAEATFADVI